MNYYVEFSQKLSQAYTDACKPLCHELNIPQTAFDILMFLANNPKYKSASEIVEIRNIKANLVSVNVDKLVKEGYLERVTLNDDRRKIGLVCTNKAQEIIEKGRKLQNSFAESLLTNISNEQKECFFLTLKMIEENLNELKNMKKEG